MEATMRAPLQKEKAAEGRPPYVLALNAGSSSLKFALVEASAPERTRRRGAVGNIGSARPVFSLDGGAGRGVAAAPHAAAAELVLDSLFGGSGDIVNAADIIATGHRVVHGGEMFSAPTIVTQNVMDQLRALASLAPLHNPLSSAVIDVVAARLADTPAVAVFDTAFFKGMPEAASRYAVPAAWHAELGIRRFGFHGIAHEYMRDRLRSIDDAAAPERAVTLQLGHGCSATALRGGYPVETSMGFTPLEGLVMGTRAGDVDAGAVLHAARRGRAWESLDAELNRGSGLLGLSGASSDVRELLALEATGHPGATLALAVFHHRILKYAGAYAAVLGGIDALAFSGGIGENSPEVRARVCAGLEWLGLELDEQANENCIGIERRISAPDSAIDVHVIRVDEEQMIARAAAVCVGASTPTRSAGSSAG
jgi:acetate kinase